MIYTQIIKNYQNNSTTTTIKFKLSTQQFHEVYYTHNFTWNRSTDTKKSQLLQKHLNHKWN